MSDYHLTGPLISAAPASTYETSLPQLDGLMELRDALVALKGPLASDPDLQETVHKFRFNEEICERILGKPDSSI